MRMVIIAVVTLLIGGGIVGVILFKNATPEGLPAAAGHRQLAEYLAQEHLAVARSGSAEQFSARTPEEVPDRSSQWIGRRMEFEDTLFAEDSGLRFIGAREAHIPGTGRSAHLLFAAEDGTYASLFLQQYLAQPATTPNVAYSLPASRLGRDAPPVIIWRTGGQVHFLVSQKPEGVAALRRSLGIPEPTQKY
jgi:hypothetical protein